MGSPLGPALANLFMMGFYEKKWLESLEGSKVRFYRRYVDDIFCLFDSEYEADNFLQYLNKQHPNIKFTIEKEHRKPTYTGLLMNFNCFSPSTYKKSLIKTLVDRTYQINSTWFGFDYDLKILKTILKKNEFPIKHIDNTVRNYLHNKHKHENIDTKSTNSMRYYKLPYVGSFSTYTQKRLMNVIKRYCKPEISIKLVFTTFKIGFMFSFKDSIPFDLKSSVVYKFECVSCNACYIGETSRHLSTRIKEHLKSDKQSHIYKHLQTSDTCKQSCNENCFSILDSATSKYSLRIKEGIHIK